MNNNSQFNKILTWLKKICSLQFLGVCIALVAAYFAWIPIRSYFIDDNPIEVSFYTPVELSDDINRSDTVYVWVLTHEKMNAEIGSLFLFNNKSNHTVEGVNIDISFEAKNINSIISPGWEYLRRGKSFEVRNTKQELRPHDKLWFPINELMCFYSLDNNGNVIDPYEIWFTASAEISYDGCENSKFFNIFLFVLQLEHDSYSKKYGNTDGQNRRGFNDEFLTYCLKYVKDTYELHPGYFDKYYIYINLFDNPVVLNKDDVIKLCEERGIV